MKPTDYTNSPTHNNQKTTRIHFYGIEEKCYPFSILEETEYDPDGEVSNQTYEIVLGNTKVIDKKFINLLMAEDYILSKPYELITSLVCYIIESHAQFVKENVELKKLKENEVQ